MEVDGERAVQGCGVKLRVVGGDGEGDDGRSFMRDDGKLGARGDHAVAVVARNGNRGELVLVCLDLCPAFD